MTTKERFIHNLHQARTSHIRWVNSIKLLISGININENQITLDAIASEFGVWFYHEAMLFTLGTSRMVLEEIEELFLALHDKYMKIYPIYYANNKKTLFGSFLGSKKASEYEIEFSHRHYEEIVALSDKLKHKLRILESQLMSLPEEKFDTVAGFTKFETAEEMIELKISTPSNNEENTYFYGARGRG
jgi:hypothetical protein